MPDILNEEMRKTAASTAPDKKTGRLALRFCEQCFRIRDAQIIDDRSIVGPNLDFDFTNELGVIGVVNQMCLAYGLRMDMEKQKNCWLVTINRMDDRTFAAPAFASSPILRRALLQVALHAHGAFVLPYLDDAR